MIAHGKVEANIKPEEIAVDEYSVWHAENIEETTRETEEGTELVYSFELTQYTKDEYILLAIEQNQLASNLAIAELAETLMGVI